VNGAFDVVNVAKSLVGFIVSAGFVGLFSDIESSLPKCESWLEDAIESNENFGMAPKFHLYQLREARAVASWLSTGRIEEALWQETLDGEISAVRETNAYCQGDLRTLRLDQLIPVAMLANAPSIAVREYEASHSAVPVKSGTSVSPRKYGYAVARAWSRDGDGDSREELFAWGKQVLRDDLDDWLSRGQYIIAAKWVCFVYALLGGETSAPAALISALDNLKSS
jgi:hypothetical protein